MIIQILNLIDNISYKIIEYLRIYIIYLEIYIVIYILIVVIKF